MATTHKMKLEYFRPLLWTGVLLFLLPDGWSVWHLLAVTLSLPLGAIGYYACARNWGWFVVFGGGMLNKVCMWANGGFMPVVGYDAIVLARNHKWIIAGPDTNLLFLADIFYGASIGDFIATTGLPLTIGIWLYRKRRK